MLLRLLLLKRRSVWNRRRLFGIGRNAGVGVVRLNILWILSFCWSSFIIVNVNIHLVWIIINHLDLIPIAVLRFDLRTLSPFRRDHNNLRSSSLRSIRSFFQVFWFDIRCLFLRNERLTSLQRPLLRVATPETSRLQWIIIAQFSYHSMWRWRRMRPLTPCIFLVLLFFESWLWIAVGITALIVQKISWLQVVMTLRVEVMLHHRWVLELREVVVMGGEAIEGRGGHVMGHEWLWRFHGQHFLLPLFEQGLNHVVLLRLWVVLLIVIVLIMSPNLLSCLRSIRLLSLLAYRSLWLMLLVLDLWSFSYDCFICGVI